MIDSSIIQAIGNTPLIKLHSVTEGLSDGVEVYVKAELLNPGGSVKDRPALRMILEGIRSGKLTKDKIIMDPTSGNTGVAYAMIGAALGYEVELVVPENVSRARKQTSLAYGAKLTFSSAMEGSDGAILLSQQLKEENPDKYFMPNQYANQFNPQAHYETTGVEIYEQTQGRVTHFITGIGTSGTVMGVGRRLKEYSSEIQVHAAEPAEALHGLEGLKHMASSIVPKIYHPSELDGVMPVATEAGYEMTERLALEEGLFVGHSSGANVWAALELARTLDQGVVVTILCDSGSRYLC